MEWVQHFHENVCALSEAKGMYKTMKNIVAATLRLIDYWAAADAGGPGHDIHGSCPAGDLSGQGQ